jgi:hypothetical protein
VFDSGEEGTKYSSCQRGQKWFKWPLGKSTLHPLKIVFTSTTFCIWFFCVSINITSWIIFLCLKYIGLYLNLKQSIKKKTPKKFDEFQHIWSIFVMK